MATTEFDPFAEDSRIQRRIWQETGFEASNRAWARGIRNATYEQLEEIRREVVREWRASGELELLADELRSQSCE